MKLLFILSLPLILNAEPMVGVLQADDKSKMVIEIVIEDCVTRITVDKDEKLSQKSADLMIDLAFAHAENGCK